MTEETLKKALELQKKIDQADELCEYLVNQLSIEFGNSSRFDSSNVKPIIETIVNQLREMQGIIVSKFIDLKAGWVKELEEL